MMAPPIPGGEKAPFGVKLMPPLAHRKNKTKRPAPRKLQNKIKNGFWNHNCFVEFDESVILGFKKMAISRSCKAKSPFKTPTQKNWQKIAPANCY